MNNGKKTFMRSFKIAVISAVAVSFFNTAFGQGEIEDKVVIIEKERKLDLPEANRNFEKVHFDVKTPPAKPQEYKLEEVKLNLPSLPSKIKLLMMPDEPLKKFYGNYVKAGFGNYGTPYLEAFINSKRSEKYLYGLHYKHYSSKNGPVGKSLSGMSDNLAEAYGKYFTSNQVISGGIGYSRMRFNYYGGDENLLKFQDIKQVYQLFNVNAGIENLDKTNQISYNLGLNYYHLSDRFKAKEGEFLADFNGVYKLDEDRKVNVGAILSLSNRKDSSKVNRAFFILKPSYSMVMDKIRLNLGFNVAYTNDSVKSVKGVHLYPNLKAEYDVVDKQLIAYAGLDGEMQKNTLRKFVYDNPYLGNNAAILHTNKSIEFFVGAKGHVIGKLNYNARFSYQNYKNLYFFNNGNPDTSRFVTLYDKGNTSLTQLTGELSYDVSKELLVEYKLNYYGYNVSDFEYAWERPSFYTSFSGRYNLEKKIFINVDIYYISGLKAKNFVKNEVVKLKSITDLNLKVEYRFSPAFSAFLEFNNILSKKYQRYLYYPVKGINVLGGLTYSF